PGHPERPERIVQTVPILKDRHLPWEWREPRAATIDELLRAHSREHIEHVKNPTGDFDPDTPAIPKIYDHALKSAGASIEAACAALAGERSFVLMRPPGHHATRNRAMGFCYFSNVAIAALDALEHGAERVAIWDFDALTGTGPKPLSRTIPGSNSHRSINSPPTPEPVRNRLLTSTIIQSRPKRRGKNMSML